MRGSSHHSSRWGEATPKLEPSHKQTRLTGYFNEPRDVVVVSMLLVEVFVAMVVHATWACNEGGCLHAESLDDVLILSSMQPTHQQHQHQAAAA